mmetsp:Transcript_21778/g.73826  ORF Transcript_21778/g.73826 Transcript_21778/m.73826 type:complete len:337 (+) Transcript_21778:40-1050(+)
MERCAVPRPPLSDGVTVAAVVVVFVVAAAGVGLEAAPVFDGGLEERHRCCEALWEALWLFPRAPACGLLGKHGRPGADVLESVEPKFVHRVDARAGVEEGSNTVREAHPCGEVERPVAVVVGVVYRGRAADEERQHRVRPARRGHVERLVTAGVARVDVGAAVVEEAGDGEGVCVGGKVRGHPCVGVAAIWGDAAVQEFRCNNGVVRGGGGAQVGVGLARAALRDLGRRLAVWKLDRSFCSVHQKSRPNCQVPVRHRRRRRLGSVVALRGRPGPVPRRRPRAGPRRDAAVDGCGLRDTAVQAPLEAIPPRAAVVVVFDARAPPRSGRRFVFRRRKV